MVVLEEERRSEESCVDTSNTEYPDLGCVVNQSPKTHHHIFFLSKKALLSLFVTRRKSQKKWLGKFSRKVLKRSRSIGLYGKCRTKKGNTLNSLSRSTTVKRSRTMSTYTNTTQKVFLSQIKFIIKFSLTAQPEQLSSKTVTHTII